MARKREDMLRQIRGVVAREREAEIEYGLKEFIQGAIIGFIIGFLIASQLL